MVHPQGNLVDIISSDGRRDEIGLRVRAVRIGIETDNRTSYGIHALRWYSVSGKGLLCERVKDFTSQRREVTRLLGRRRHSRGPGARLTHARPLVTGGDERAVGEQRTPCECAVLVALELRDLRARQIEKVFCIQGRVA